MVASPGRTVPLGAMYVRVSYICCTTSMVEVSLGSMSGDHAFLCTTTVRAVTPWGVVVVVVGPMVDPMVDVTVETAVDVAIEVAVEVTVPLTVVVETFWDAIAKYATAASRMITTTARAA